MQSVDEAMEAMVLLMEIWGDSQVLEAAAGRKGNQKLWKAK